MSSSSARDEQFSFVRRPHVSQKREPRLVPKEKQLEKLRSRLDKDRNVSVVKARGEDAVLF